MKYDIDFIEQPCSKTEYLIKGYFINIRHQWCSPMQKLVQYPRYFHCENTYKLHYVNMQFPKGTHFTAKSATLTKIISYGKLVRCTVFFLYIRKEKGLCGIFLTFTSPNF